jgi:exopolyphosphatase / guanosine-5'-triphosphate,3'-diphosphate pyrophosphatase
VTSTVAERRPTGPPESATVRVGVIDAGANTLRLLVARAKQRELTIVCEERVRLGLGEDIERMGHLSDEKLAEVAVAAAAQAERARSLRCTRLEVLVTSPGRQSANAEELRETLERATGAPVRLLSGEEEAILGYTGAVSGRRRLPKSVVVCDVGGGSTQVVVGTADGGVAWARSVDVGSLRLTRRSLPGSNPPSAAVVETARAEAARCFEGVVPPAAKAGLAIGGTARALTKILGEYLGPDELERAIDLLSSRRAADIAARLRIAPQRAETLLAGSIILAEVQRRVAVPFRLGAGGIREGAVLELLAERAVA